MNENDITLLAAILAFCASVIATLASVYNGRFRRYAEQKWWEKKAHAYERIIEALADLAFYHESHLRAAEMRQDIPDARAAEIQEYWKRGHAEVKRATAVGAFIISSEAEAALHRYWKDGLGDNQRRDFYSAVESDYDSINRCIKAVVEAAKRDLGR